MLLRHWLFFWHSEVAYINSCVNFERALSSFAILAEKVRDKILFCLRINPCSFFFIELSTQGARVSGDMQGMGVLRSPGELRYDYEENMIVDTCTLTHFIVRHPWTSLGGGGEPDSRHTREGRVIGIGGRREYINR